MGFVEIALAALPWAGPGVAVSCLFAIGWSVWRRSSGTSMVAALGQALLIAWVGCFLSVTVTPGTIVELGQGASFCGLEMSSPTGPGSSPDRLLNVALCIPAGLMAVAATSWRAGWIAAAAAAPIAVELVQFLAPVLGRACQLVDVQDNLQGTLIGAVIGAVIATLRSRRVAAEGADRPELPSR